MKNASLDNVKRLHDFNLELLNGTLKLLERVKEYCKERGLPSPVKDSALDYRMNQIDAIIKANNEFVRRLPTRFGQPKWTTEELTLYIAVHRHSRRGSGSAWTPPVHVLLPKLPCSGPKAQ